MAAAAVLCMRIFSSSLVVPLHCQSHEDDKTHFKAEIIAQTSLGPEMHVEEEKQEKEEEEEEEENSVTRKLNEVGGCLLRSSREVRRLQPENEAGNSWGEYYRACAEVDKGVPFEWESRPGTPKRDFLVTHHENAIESDSIPPLSPPPRLKAMYSFKSGGPKSCHRSLFHKMRRLLRSPSQAWI